MSSDETPEDRWQFLLNVVGLLVVAVLITAFFLFYGSGLMSFVNTLLAPGRAPY